MYRELRKGVADLPLAKTLGDLSRPVTANGHRSRGLHPLVGEDARLAELLLRGKFAINGLRNRTIRERLFPETTDETEFRRQSGRVCRLLRLFRDDGLIHQVKGTRRYDLTAHGCRTLPAFPRRAKLQHRQAARTGA